MVTCGRFRSEGALVALGRVLEYLLNLYRKGLVSVGSYVGWGAVNPMARTRMQDLTAQ